MFDFYLGSSEEIRRDEHKFLISVKRMMPRWVNSIADSELLALAAILDEQGKFAKEHNQRFVTVETGAGASSLAFAYYAMKYDGIAYSWDLNGEKGSLIRTICTETLGNYFRKLVDNHWKLLAFFSTSEHLGIPVLKDLNPAVHMFFHDSEHTWQTIEKEIQLVTPFLVDGAVVALDDANLECLHTNVGYINTMRKKHGLEAIRPIEGNQTEPFYVKAEALLRTQWETVDHIPDLYKQNYKDDAYFTYYNSEFKINSGFGTVNADNMEHRFDSWRVFKKKTRS
ncbi:MAG: class I SAM-dependent methyltransferase [Pseudobdellovibrionaceae bacterium]|uniref:class I SAM-dependent methyltransferase n=1 Tax=Oligoflexus sp. TaxID=1971216 RepID=UPI0027C95BFA|nr:class I SAM-dependent methyltransferase [Oligoflexus sp.]MDQ3234291.1 class I SAM-dependent methyltransferase [Pseudobdellovibrionaceae bacterium]HYX35375.1 class I SAM-dependent methyltransferase [Oligoflexus sp.]